MFLKQDFCSIGVKSKTSFLSNRFNKSCLTIIAVKCHPLFNLLLHAFSARFFSPDSIFTLLTTTTKEINLNIRKTFFRATQSE